MNNINEFLKEYLELCKKYNIQLVATGYTFRDANLNISNLTNNVLTSENIYFYI